MRSTVPGVPPMPALDVEREMAAHAADPMRRRQRWAARRPWLIVAGALSVLVVVFGGLGAFIGRDGPTQQQIADDGLTRGQFASLPAGSLRWATVVGTREPLWRVAAELTLDQLRSFLAGSGFEVRVQQATTRPQDRGPTADPQSLDPLVREHLPAYVGRNFRSVQDTKIAPDARTVSYARDDLACGVVVIVATT